MTSVPTAAGRRQGPPRPPHDPMVCGLDGPGVSPTCPGCIAAAEAARTRYAAPPRSVRAVLASARRRYHALGRTERPALGQPTNCVGLFSAPEMLLLAQRAHWPLSAEAIAWIAEPPARRVRRRRRLERRIAAVVREVLAAELPAAIAHLAGEGAMTQRRPPKTVAEMIQERYPLAGRNGEPRAEEGASGPEPAPSVETFTASALMKMQLPEPRWAVEGILPEGLSLLAGKPKLGKSWLALGLALAVASGGTALGSVAVKEGDVLYLALEDTKRRLQGRLDKLLRRQNAAPPDRLTLATDWPRQDKGGLAALSEWLGSHKQARLVIIDTWVKFKPRALVRTNEYEMDTANGAELKSVADQEGLALLAVTHCRKMGAADPLEEVSGSVGLTGVADAVLVLRRERGQFDAVLHVTGRDVEEQELALCWQPEYAQWSIVGQAEEHRVSKERAEVLNLLRRTGRPMKPTEVSLALSKGLPNVKSMLWRMASDELLRSVDGGYYAVSSNPSNPSSRNNSSDQGNHRERGSVADGPEPSNRPSNPDDLVDDVFPK